VRPRSVAWLGIVAAIGIAANVALVYVLDGRLSGTDGRISVSAVALLLSGAAAVAALELFPRRPFAPLAAFALLAVPFAATAMLYGLWSFEGDGDDEAKYFHWAYTGLLWTAASILATTAPLLARNQRLARALAPAVMLATILAAAHGTRTIWTNGRSDGVTRAFLASAIVAFAVWLATPALDRARREPAPRS
jgi:hypothetical protein